MPKKIEQEWLGTRLSWHLEAHDGHSTIHFEHLGRNPSLHCYGICLAGWDLFLVDSLKAYLDTGVGKPFRAG
ncbi:SRPBCC family protein [Pseudomonas paeninsulae]|uniref:hypothetical protein n=1 Tax=Pseudomonas paeninsulae TaxID=3110772 RepID=UPI002D7A23F1|nr:hypothetical protein [Pseudomonas sp. IT1137]